MSSIMMDKEMEIMMEMEMMMSIMMGPKKISLARR